MGRLAVAAVAILVACSVAAHADRGSIPFEPGVQVYEPVQRAMIAWNGVEEILILSTDLRASRDTKVLEVIPMPAKPVVTKGDVAVFRRAEALIRSKNESRSKSQEVESLSRSAEGPAGEVAFHEVIGSHDVSVVRVLSRGGFVEWVDSYLRQAGVGNPVVPDPMRATVEEYLKDGYSWFVFDVVSLKTSPRTNEAIQYRFASQSLFFPLRISRSNVGDTSVELLLLTPKALRRFPALPGRRVELPQSPVRITREELRSLSPDMDALLGSRENMLLRIWRIRGDFSSFSADLIARP